jgi:tetratricopeptide (TPR) repeat protein
MPGRPVVAAFCWLVGGAILALAAAPGAVAIQSGGSEQAGPADPDYAAGEAAFDREDWQGLLDHMSRVVEENPNHDDALNLMGFAYRKLGDYDRALESYDRALQLNPRHRGALEYLGEAYLELDQPELAKATLDRLEAECGPAVASVTDGGCEEWEDLKQAYDDYVAEHREQ